MLTTSSAYSNHLNKSRLAQLRAKEQAIQAIFTEVQDKLVSLSNDSNKYKELLEKLIVQVYLLSCGICRRCGFLSPFASVADAG